MDYLIRKEGYSPVKVPAVFKFCNTVCVGVREANKKGPDGKKHQEHIYRASVSTMEEAEDWLEKFSTVTHTRWLPRPGLKSNGQSRFEASLSRVCTFQRGQKKKDSPNNLECPAYVYLKIKKLTPAVTKKDPYIRFGFKGDGVPRPAEIYVCFDHSHHLLNYDTLTHNRMLGPVKRQLDELFAQNKGPVEVEKIITRDLEKAVSESGSPMKGKIVVLKADAGLNPKPAAIYYRHKKFMEKKFGSDDSPITKVNEKIESGYYKSLGLDVFTEQSLNGEWSILVVTQVMWRVQATELAREAIFVDSTSHVDTSLSTVTLMSAQTKAGAMQICALIHQRQTQSNMTQAFALFRLHCPKAFGGNEEPQSFMTDDSSAERNSLNYVWPTAVLLLCTFHVLKNEWHWLMGNENEHVRQGLMALFKQAMYAAEVTDFNDAQEKITNLLPNNEKFVKKFQKFCLRAPEWAIHARQDLMTRGHETNNFSEASMLIVKAKVLQREYSTNAVSLVEELGVGLNEHSVHRLVAHANGRHGHEATMEKLLSNYVKPPTIKPKGVNYEVQSEEFEEHFYEVDPRIGLCECPSGMRGCFCKHLAALVKFEGVACLTGPAVHPQDRKQLLYLAYGSDIPPSNFYLRKDQPSTSMVPEDLVFDCEVGLVNPDTSHTKERLLRPKRVVPQLQEAAPKELHEELKRKLLESFECFVESSLTAGCSAPVALKMVEALKKASKSNSPTSHMVSMYRKVLSYRKKSTIKTNIESIKKRKNPSTSGTPLRAGRPRNNKEVNQDAAPKATIKVNKPAVSRRKTQTKTKSALTQGRPSKGKNEQEAPKKGKRKHNLAEAVRQNKRNATSH